MGILRHGECGKLRMKDQWHGYHFLIYIQSLERVPESVIDTSTATGGIVNFGPGWMTSTRIGGSGRQHDTRGKWCRVRFELQCSQIFSSDLQGTVRSATTSASFTEAAPILSEVILNTTSGSGTATCKSITDVASAYSCQQSLPKWLHLR